MKRAFLLFLLLLMIVQPLRAQTTPLSSSLSLDVPATIQAGAPLTVTVHAQAKASVTLALYNGLARLATILTADGNGSALWQIPAGALTSAGDSLIIADMNNIVSRQRLHVSPGAVNQLDFVTSVNNLTAYGKARAQLIALVGDQYGNPLSLNRLDLEARYPNAQTRHVSLPSKFGLAWTWLSSAGSPGRLRLSLTAASLVRTLELAQMPSVPEHVMLRLSPNCLLSDGRDLVTLVATVTDDHDNPVADSTWVRFSWNQGEGSAQVFNGEAALRVPAPASAGEYTFIATSSNVSSLPAQLQVQAEGCS